jgi:integrase
MRERLRQYAAVLGERAADAVFFPAPDSGSYHPMTIYAAFRSLLWAAGIAHGGRGHGPRLHDLRHTFAVHRLLQWYQDGTDLTSKLPVLATYLGHQSISDTQRYLQLTAAFLPELAARCEAHFGQIIPRRITL